MQNLAFEFETEQELRDVMKKLWETLGVSGEMSARPLAGGRWRLELHSEKDLRESTLEKFSVNRVESGD